MGFLTLKHTAILAVVLVSTGFFAAKSWQKETIEDDEVSENHISFLRTSGPVETKASMNDSLISAARVLQQGESCCTWNYKSCSSAWCSSSEKRCGRCGGIWFDVDENPSCTDWKSSCSSDSDCCRGLICENLGNYNGCTPGSREEAPSPPTPSPVAPTSAPVTPSPIESTGSPSATPSADPSATPSATPSASPIESTGGPTPTPSAEPSATPSATPSAQPSTQPSASPSATPSAKPSATPSAVPSASPSSQPSPQPSATPTTAAPTEYLHPTHTPTVSLKPSATPSAQPSASPSSLPSAKPNATPSTEPSAPPSSKPSATPSADPSALPSNKPSASPSATPTAGPSEAPGKAEACCTWDFQSCGSDAWCNSAEENCVHCGSGYWSPVYPPEICTKRWSWCNNDSACCGTMTCEDLGSYTGCAMPGDAENTACCTNDLKECDHGHCNISEETCADCGFFWMTLTDDDNCLARFDTCQSDSDCCESMICSTDDESDTNCGIEGVDFDPSTSTSTSASTSTTETSTSTSTGTSTSTTPTEEISTSTTPMETSTLTGTTPTETVGVPNLPMDGPFITSGYSELVTIPQPGLPSDMNAPQTNCPHWESGLPSWDDLNLTPPTPGADVVIPDNTRLIVLSSVPVELGYVTVPASSELIIGEDPINGISITMKGMTVYGKLTAGSESCRIDAEVTLTLTGTRPSNAVQSPPEPKVKGINVEGGEISLHGRRFYRTWTRLSQTVEVGDDILMLQDSINWEAGQEIILVTTAMKDARDWHQNEIIKIKHVYDAASLPNDVGGAVWLETPIDYRHVANSGYQAEVGLLTRTIKIQGSETDSEPTDLDPGCITEQKYQNDPSRPCDAQLTGYGAHVMVHSGGLGFVEGVEFFRVGQTNVLGRYPMHFHLLGDCPDCYLKDSSIHRSYYRCISIHGTHQTTVSENVAFDVSGFCYYLEDGIERENNLLFNLATHIHMIGPEPPRGSGQQTPVYVQSDTLTLPADVSASGFYITNIGNNVIGNAASGGWAGFAFPNLREPVGLSRGTSNISPVLAHPLTIDGNTAHSAGWWWYHAAAFYFGGDLFYDQDNGGVLSYNPGRNRADSGRYTCATCTTVGCGKCNYPRDQKWVPITNSKAYLNAGVGFGSWSGRLEVLGYESHDNGLALEALASGFWIDNMLAACRSGEPIAIPDLARITQVNGDGFFWYDTNQDHIMTDATFRQCGYRSNAYDQYNTSPDRGCGDDPTTGCASRSTVFGFLAHSDQFNPEIMQGTSGIAFENVGRRFRLNNYRSDQATTVSGRGANWIDADGSASELGVPAIIASGLPDARSWWEVDGDTVHDPQGPLTFIKSSVGPERGLGHVHFEWDSSLHSQVGGTLCVNGQNKPCPAVGYIRHRGPMFSGDVGLPVTANADIAGLSGGYGWYLDLLNGAPKQITFKDIEVDPDNPLMFSVAYPPGTTVSVTAVAAPWCNRNDPNYGCEEPFMAVASIEDVRTSMGNTYHFSSDGVLTFRIIQAPKAMTGNPDWFKFTWESMDRHNGWYALNRFERKGILLPRFWYGPTLVVTADCTGSGAYCDYNPSSPPSVDDVCPQGFTQEAYDRCCQGSHCVYADGSSGPNVFS